VFNYSADYVMQEFVPKTENAIRYLKSFGILPESIDVKKVEDVLRASYRDKPLNNITEDEIICFLRNFIGAFKNYELEKSNLKGAIDYADMLIKFVNNYEQHARYKYVMVDELQDVNELEAQIAILSGESFFLVGDPKQAIFGFQGGSLANFKKFEAREDMQKEIRSLNYRSLQPVLDYAKTHFLNNTKDKNYEQELAGLKADRQSGNADVRVYMADNANNQINAALQLLSTLNPGKNEKTAIITRTNEQLIKLSKALDRKDIEYNITASSSTSQEAKEQIISYLKGLLYDDKETVINALFTPFSGLPLKEAFQISEKWGKDPSFIESTANSFFKIKKRLKIENLKDLFDEIILPISMQIGKDYFLSAKSLYDGFNQYINTLNEKSRDGLFDYLSLLQEDYEPVEKDVNLVLTTVHKAKGREFENVIYVPVKVNEKNSFIDLVVYSIIKATKDVDVKDELAEEQLRVDFVAFTRAKNRLYIITNEKKSGMGSYHVDGFESAVLNIENEIEPYDTKFNESYAMFLNDRYDISKKLISTVEPWLFGLIKDYFSKIDELSYSLINSMKRDDDLIEFLKEKVLRVPVPTNKAAERGSSMHDLAFKLYKNTVNEKELTNEELRYLDNIKAIDRELRAKKMKQIAAEMDLKISLKDIYNTDEPLKFKSRLDAVYGSEDKRYLILDYKTDKNEQYAADHRRQLAVYKHVFSVSENVKESDISIGIGFIGLKGNINTQTLDCKLDLTKEKASQIDTFFKHLARFLNYKKNPMQFVKDIMSLKYDEILDNRIVEELKKEFSV
jgi:DNA helicase-2/ATP-dependent DNA helicase PcrA